MSRNSDSDAQFERDEKIEAALCELPEDLTVDEAQAVIEAIVMTLFEDYPHLAPNFLIFNALRLQTILVAMEEREDSTTH